MKISVLCTVLNDANGIQKMLRSLQGQEGPFEVVIVDAGSTDGTVEVINENWWKDLDVKFVSFPGCSRGKGLGLAAARASGEVYAFLGADDWAHRNWLHHIRLRFQDGAEVLRGHNVLVGKGPKFPHVPLYVDGQNVAYAGTNMSVLATSYWGVGKIDSRFITAEDIDFSIRAVRSGITIQYEPNAIVHRTVRSGLSIFRQAYWNGVGRRQLEEKHGRLSGMKGNALSCFFQPRQVPRLLAGAFGYWRGAK